MKSLDLNIVLAVVFMAVTYSLAEEAMPGVIFNDPASKGFGTVIYRLLAEQSSQEEPPIARIIGGDVAKIEDYPYMVSLRVQFFGLWFFICGGSLIAKNKVLTAGHCAAFALNNNLPMRVLLGSDDYVGSPGSQLIDVDEKKIKVHSGFSREGDFTHKRRGYLGFDLAVLTLEKDAELNEKVQILPLADDGPLATYEDADCIVAGFGVSEFASRNLMVQKERYVPLQECKTAWDTFTNGIVVIREHNVCGADETSTPCSGDSGSPMVCNGVGVALVSFGTFPCVAGSIPNVYANIAYSKHWIDCQINEHDWNPVG